MGTKNQYAAMMLFQFRVEKNKVSNIRRVCEERIILFKAGTAKRALAMAQKRGKDEEFFYSSNGADIFFEFVGIIDLIKLGVSAEPDEVWYRLIEKVKPMERRDLLLPKEKDLTALGPDRVRKRGRVTVP